MRADQERGHPPLKAPHYGVGFQGALRRFFTKYADFSGRASLSEYWWVGLAQGLITIGFYSAFIVAFVSAAAFGIGPWDGTFGSIRESGSVLWVIASVGLMYLLATLVPSLALTARRLHDAGLSGWVQVVVLLPIFGPMLLFVLVARKSSDEALRYEKPR